MDTKKHPGENLTFQSTPFPRWGLRVALWVGILTLVGLPMSSLATQDMHVGQAEPSQVAVGQTFTIHGQFPDMTSAAVFLSDGVYGLPVTVLNVTDQEISARIDAMPWPMTGTLHVMSLEEGQQIPQQTWQGSGVTLEVLGGVQFQSAQAAFGGVLTVAGSPPFDPMQVFAAAGGGLGLNPDGPCSGSTVLILIEPDLDAPTLQLPPPGCKGILVEVFIGCEDGANMPVANYYSTLAAGLQDLLSLSEIQVSFDPNASNSANGTLSIAYPVGCPDRAAAAALLAP